MAQPLVISGPSGCGKSTILKKVFEKYPDSFGFSVSHTTRKPRPGEVNGVNYHFASVEDFEKLKAQGGFIETAQFAGNWYGTSVQAVKTVGDSGKICILDIEMQGVKSVKNTDLGAKYVFISPPSMQVLEERLRGRGTETEESIAKRLKAAQMEMEYASLPGSHDFIVINDDLDLAFQRLDGYLRQTYHLDNLTTAVGNALAGSMVNPSVNVQPSVQ